MRPVRSRYPLKAALLSLGLAFPVWAAMAPAGVSLANAGQGLVGIETGLPLPRFVSLKAGKVNVRVGPSRSHPVLWVYQRKGMPIEVVAEFEHWRRIRDADGDTGWIFHTLLDGTRTALIRPQDNSETVPLRAEPDRRSETIAAAEPGVIAELEACRPDWCLLKAGGYSGWVAKSSLWGAYSDERFE